MGEAKMVMADTARMLGRFAAGGFLGWFAIWGVVKIVKGDVDPMSALVLTGYAAAVAAFFAMVGEVVREALHRRRDVLDQAPKREETLRDTLEDLPYKSPLRPLSLRGDDLRADLAAGRPAE